MYKEKLHEGSQRYRKQNGTQGKNNATPRRCKDKDMKPKKMFHEAKRHKPVRMKQGQGCLCSKKRKALNDAKKEKSRF